MSKLYLSQTDKKMAGVCGGIAEYFEMDPLLVRLGMIAVCLLTGILPVVLFYIIAAFMIPKRSDY